MLGEDPFRKRLTSYRVGLPRTVCSFGNDFIALEMKESLLTFHDDNFCKFHVLYACEGDACALKTRGRFVTERGKKKKTKPKFKSGLHCLGNNSSFDLRGSLSCHATGKLGNSNVLYHKKEEPRRAKTLSNVKFL